jgi:hypothetical protein
MATAQPGNTVAMVAAVADEEAGLEAEDPMQEDRYSVMCRFFTFFFYLPLVDTTTQKRGFLGFRKYKLEDPFFTS